MDTTHTAVTVMIRVASCGMFPEEPMTLATFLASQDTGDGDDDGWIAETTREVTALQPGETYDLTVDGSPNSTYATIYRL